MDLRETAITVFGVTRIIRTERKSTIRALEMAHTKAVRDALTELHNAGKSDALRAARKAAQVSEAAAYQHASGPMAQAAHNARRRVRDIEKRKFTAPSFPDLKARMRPEPVKFDLSPTDPMFADIHEFFDPDAEPAAPESPAEEAPPKNVQERLDWSLPPSTS
ncbi:hypothetical protein V1460_25600 [Streptomyces sp. SCSIO 30461]|uniref:hypothetical protein n=1 Tax=Streptomyces sp. SCSIO 30461 TaxID=3118085 RepID=UPI0030CADB94